MTFIGEPRGDCGSDCRLYMQSCHCFREHYGDEAYTAALARQDQAVAGLRDENRRTAAQ